MDFRKAESYLKIAIDADVIIAYSLMVCLHLYHTNKYDEAKKYLDIAIEKNSPKIKLFLADYHRIVTKNLDEMFKNYLLAVKETYKAGFSIKSYVSKWYPLDTRRKHQRIFIEQAVKHNVEFLNNFSDLNEIVGVNLSDKLCETMYPYLQSLTKLRTGLKNLILKYMWMKRFVEASELKDRMPPRLIAYMTAL